MDWQIYLTGFLVGAAGVYVLLRGRRAWRGMKGGCGGGCGCAKSAETKKPTVLIAPEQLRLRR